MKEILDWGLHIVIAIVVGFLIVTFVGQRTVVNGTSMLPTLDNSDQLIIEKISPRIGNLHYGDIITIDVTDHSEVVDRSPIIKRVIGLPGDLVEVKDRKVYVNGKEKKEDYINGNETLEGNSDFSKVTVPEGQVYVMGDNRLPNGSLDSRIIGPLEIKKVGGKAILRFWPLDKFGTLKK